MLLPAGPVEQAGAGHVTPAISSKTRELTRICRRYRPQGNFVLLIFTRLWADYTRDYPQVVNVETSLLGNPISVSAFNKLRHKRGRRVLALKQERRLLTAVASSDFILGFHPSSLRTKKM